MIAGATDEDGQQRRRMAESFGTDAERYDRARPRYPDALVNRVISASSGPAMLDVGCGTGIAARQFQAAGCTVLGVEPDARMAEFARAHGLEVEVAAGFETWDSDGRMFDAVIAAQSWHWVDPIAGAAKAARLLRPGGLLAVFGHVFEPPDPIGQAFAAAYRRVVPDLPVNRQARRTLQLYRAMYGSFAVDIEGTGEFGTPEQWRFDWEQAYSREQWLDLLATTGGLTELASDRLAEVLDAVGSAIDGLGGRFTMPYTTFAITSVRSKEGRS